MQYSKLKSDYQKPNFDYVVLTRENLNKYEQFTPDYFLYKKNELEQAYMQLGAEIAKGNRYATLNEVVYVNGMYRVRPIFTGEANNKIVCADGEMGLHCYWIVRSGNWLNHRTDI